MQQPTGKLIVTYGINNLGKSTQANMLVDRMNAEGYPTIYVKYPIYDIEPSGKMLNDYLRGGNPHGFSSREAQMLYILNRTQFQKHIEEVLAKGTHVIAEDYIGTGIAWGTGSGVDIKLLTRLNNHLLLENLVFLFEGKRFIEAREDGHLFENNDPLTQKVQTIHNTLGETYGWIRINANREKHIIHEEIWAHVKRHFGQKIPY